MYDYIKGKLSKITAKFIVVETAGLGYVIYVANPTLFQVTLIKKLPSTYIKSFAMMHIFYLVFIRKMKKKFS